MKKHKLKISNKKCLIKEVELSIKDIVSTTGVGETASALNQLIKVAAANVKLTLDVVLSFRSFSITKIYNNINKANKKFGSRVRTAMRKLDRNIDDLSRDSMAKEAFYYSAPLIALTDYVRKEVDDAGGLLNYLEDPAQNFLVGNLVADVYNLYDAGINKALEFNDKKTKDKFNIDKRGLSAFKNKEQIKELKRKIREEFGERGEQIIEDLIEGNNTEDVQKLIDIVNNKQDLDRNSLHNALLNHLRGTTPDPQEASSGQQRRRRHSGTKRKKTPPIKPSRTRKNENFQIKRYSLIIEKDEIKKVDIKEVYAKVLITCMQAINFEKDFINMRFKDISNEEENVKQDIKEFSDLLELESCDAFMLQLSNNFLDKKELDFNQVENAFKNIRNLNIDNEVKKNIEKFINDFKKETSNQNNKDISNSLLGILENIVEKDQKQNKEYNDYVKNLLKYSNVSDSDFIKIKEAFKKVYKNNLNYNIQNMKQSLEKLSKEDNENKTA